MVIKIPLIRIFINFKLIDGFIMYGILINKKYVGYSRTVCKEGAPDTKLRLTQNHQLLRSTCDVTGILGTNDMWFLGYAKYQ